MASDLRAAIRDVVIVLAVFAVTGVACGYLWHWWWSPAPEGFAFGGDPYITGADAEFRGTGLYVVIGLAVGLVLGLVLALLLSRNELVTLGAILAGGVLAGALMAWVGHELGPRDAADQARHAKDFATITGELRVQPWGPDLAFPAGAIGGALVALLGITPKPAEREPNR